MGDLAPVIAIVDYGLGNLHSVQQACAQVGLQAVVTRSRAEILQAEAVILPGVGAYGDAMAQLRQLDLVSVLRDIAASPKPLVGICLGMQLLMTESFEFGRHPGLGIIAGAVVQFDHPIENARVLKVPQIGWNRIYKPQPNTPWETTWLAGLPEGAYLYFVHSYFVQPQNPDVIQSVARYGHIEFCASLQYGQVWACQFHPERSGPAGLHLYRNLSAQLHRTHRERQ